MDKKTINLIKQHLRLATIKWSVKNEVLKKAKITYPKYKKDGSLSKQSFVRFKCRRCEDTFKRKEVEVDHIIAVGGFVGCWNSFISRLFCDLSGLQVLCKKCHIKKGDHGKK